MSGAPVNMTAGLVDKLDEVLDTGMAVRFDGRWLVPDLAVLEAIANGHERLPEGVTIRRYDDRSVLVLEIVRAQ